MSAMVRLPASTAGRLSGGDWSDRLMRDSNNIPRRILSNCLIALRLSPEWKGVIAYNEFALRVVALRPTPFGFTGPWTDVQDLLATEWLQKNGIHVCSEIVGQAIQAVAHENPFHPPRHWLERLEWDHKPRAQTWLSAYLGAADTSYTRGVGARFLRSAVARVFRPGIKADCCLILEGAQGIGKSAALRILGGEWFTDDLGELGSKDSALQLQGAWIVELAELDSLNKSEVSRYKAFITRATDRFRPPYGKRIIESPRQCVFAGTVNHNDYLRDETGARRFWPVACTRIDLEALKRDREQLWAEAKAEYDAGAAWWLDDAGLIAAAVREQAERYEGDAWDSEVGKWAELRQDVSVSEVLANCLEKPKAQWTQSDKNRVARCLRAAKWERYYARTGSSESAREWRYRRAD